MREENERGGRAGTCALNRAKVAINYEGRGDKHKSRLSD